MSDKTARPPKPLALTGFDHVQRLWKPSEEAYVARIKPGEYYVTTKGEMILTTLGSCIAVCIRDCATHVGGMNHFMLPGGGRAGDRTSNRYGAAAMEHLINTVLTHGGARNRLEIKIFGGADMLGARTPIGQGNIDFVTAFFRTEGMIADGVDVGGTAARKVLYEPLTGKARVARLTRTKLTRVLADESDYQGQMSDQPPAGEIELF